MPIQNITQNVLACPDCEHEVRLDDAFCDQCGSQLPNLLPTRPLATTLIVTPRKSRGIYVALGLSFGLLGVHNFYANRIAPGICHLLITIALGWTIIVPVIMYMTVIGELIFVKEEGSGIPFQGYER